MVTTHPCEQEPGEDVQLRGQPGDEEQWLLAVPSTYNSAEDLRHLSPPLEPLPCPLFFIVLQVDHVLSSECFDFLSALHCDSFPGSVCLELRHYDRDRAITHAWTSLPLADAGSGRRRLQLYAPPVQLGEERSKLIPIEVHGSF